MSEAECQSRCCRAPKVAGTAWHGILTLCIGLSDGTSSEDPHLRGTSFEGTIIRRRVAAERRVGHAYL